MLNFGNKLGEQITVRNGDIDGDERARIGFARASSVAKWGLVAVAELIFLPCGNGGEREDEEDEEEEERESMGFEVIHVESGVRVSDQRVDHSGITGFGVLAKGERLEKRERREIGIVDAAQSTLSTVYGVCLVP